MTNDNIEKSSSCLVCDIQSDTEPYLLVSSFIGYVWGALRHTSDSDATPWYDMGSLTVSDLKKSTARYHLGDTAEGDQSPPSVQAAPWQISPPLIHACFCCLCGFLDSPLLSVYCRPLQRAWSLKPLHPTSMGSRLACKTIELTLYQFLVLSALSFVGLIDLVFPRDCEL